MKKEVDIRRLVQHLPLFQALNGEQLDRLMMGVRQLRLDKGRYIFQRHDPCHGMYVVVYGRVKLYLTSQHGVEKVVEIVHATQTFGEAALFLRRPYPISAQCLEDCMLLHVSDQVLSSLIESDPAFARGLLAGMSLRLVNFIQDVERYSMENPLQRVTGYLVGLSSTPKAEQFTVSLPANKNMIASRLSLAPETLSRVLHQLSAAGYIVVEGKEVTVNNPSGMLLFAQTAEKTKC